MEFYGISNHFDINRSKLSIASFENLGYFDLKNEVLTDIVLIKDFEETYVEAIHNQLF